MVKKIDAGHNRKQGNKVEGSVDQQDSIQQLEFELRDKRELRVWICTLH